MKIQKLIADRCPDQLKLPFALWTREAVRDLIERKTCKRLSLSSIGRYLRAWGSTAQRPVRRATERFEADAQAWINDEYPEIAARAKAEKAEIQWADETGLSNQANHGKSFAPKGQTPVIPLTDRRAMGGEMHDAVLGKLAAGAERFCLTLGGAGEIERQRFRSFGRA